MKTSLVRSLSLTGALLAFTAISGRTDPISMAPIALPNLTETPAEPRFPVTERVWPAQIGEASICLWNDDKLAALSLTIDDNSAPDVEWWLENAKPAGMPLTWFLISGRAGDGGFNGTWELWKRVKDAGHAIESHTVTHLHTETPNWSIEWEYVESQTQIEAGLNGHKARFLAYPGGKNSELNDPKIAAKYFLAARGTRGVINFANQIDYLSVSSMSAPQLDNPDPKKGFADLRNLLTPGTRQYRGWACITYHLLKNKDDGTRFLNFYRDNKDNLWGGTFGDVALYGQERDTATLKVEENRANRIAFLLSDQMDDAKFAFPLTVKVRLPDWKSVVAHQSDQAIEATIVEHEGAKFALVKAIPDRGLVTLTAQ